MFDAIGRIFQGLIDFVEPIVLPDWKALVDLFPVFLLIGVVGPLLSLLILGWVVYILGKPRVTGVLRSSSTRAGGSV